MWNWLSYPRSICLVIFGVIWTLVLSVIVILVAVSNGPARVIDFIVNDLWCGLLLWLAGVRVDVRGDLDILKAPGGFLLLFNHSSHLDIVTLFAKIPRRIRFGAKIELFSIPVFGRAMRGVGILPIDRKNRAKVLNVYRAAVPRMKNGECFALAPEGTRQDGAQLGPFKRGPFEFAILGEMPIVPVILVGAAEVWPRNSVLLNLGKWRRKVIVEIQAPILSHGYTLDRAGELQRRVHRLMIEAHARLRAEEVLS